ncbi:MAG: M28 family metallopeptidase [Nitrospiraceae bacterium]
MSRLSSAHRSHAWHVGALLLLLISIGCVHTIVTDIDPNTLPVIGDLANRLRDHVKFLASPGLKGREPGTEGNRAAAEYITVQFREVGLEPLASLHGFGQPISSELGDNLIGVRWPKIPSSLPRWLLIGAHYDHLGGAYLGADDNASSIAILLELARQLPALEHDAVLFVAFNTEEPPYIRTLEMGSQYFVDHLPPEIGSPSSLQAVFIMDLMGGVYWPPLKNTIFAVGAEKSEGLYRRVKEAAEGLRTEGRGLRLSPESSLLSTSLTVLPVGIHLVEEVPVVGPRSFSDYDAFRNVAVPFLFLSSGRTPHYHEPSDLPDTLNYGRMASTVGWLQHLLQLIDQDRAPYSFETQRLEFADEVASFLPLIQRAADEQTTIPGTSALSLWNVKQDREWIEHLNPALPKPEDIQRMERASIRIQCLLADFPGCFLL